MMFVVPFYRPDWEERDYPPTLRGRMLRLIVRRRGKRAPAPRPAAPFALFAVNIILLLKKPWA